MIRAMGHTHRNSLSYVFSFGGNGGHACVVEGLGVLHVLCVLGLKGARERAHNRGSLSF